MSLPIDPDVTSPAPSAWSAGAATTLVAAGGVVGTLGRWSMSCISIPSGQLPWPTLLVNISGALLLGLLVVLVTQWRHSPSVRLFIGTGVLGAYTTFSTMAIDVVQLVRDHHGGVATVYLGCSLGGGLAAAATGVAIGTRISRAAT